MAPTPHFEPPFFKRTGAKAFDMLLKLFNLSTTWPSHSQSEAEVTFCVIWKTKSCCGPSDPGNFTPLHFLSKQRLEVKACNLRESALQESPVSTHSFNLFSMLHLETKAFLAADKRGYFSVQITVLNQYNIETRVGGCYKTHKKFKILFFFAMF